MPPKGGKKLTSEKIKIIEKAVEPEPKIEPEKAAAIKPAHSIYLHILWNVILVVIIPFVILFVLTFSIAKVGIDSQVNDTLSRGLETFKYFSKEAIEQVLGIKVNEETTAAFAGKDAAVLKKFLDEQKGDRSWIDIWLALDSDGKIIASLSNASEGTVFPRPAMIQKAVKNKTALTADDVVEESEWHSTYGNWSNAWQNGNTAATQWESADSWQNERNQQNSNAAPSNFNINADANAQWTTSNTNSWTNSDNQN